MNSYEIFAQFYDSAMGDRRDSAATVNKLIRKYHRTCRSVLELACGTGEVLKYLQKDYRAAGLDVSAAMLRIAKKKLPRVRLYRRSMTSFELAERFDVIFCVFDSINHLTNWSDWKRVFRHAFVHLEQGGVFIFDVNTPAKLKKLGQGPVWVHKFGGNIMLMDVVCDKSCLSCWNVKVFEKKASKLYRLHEENIYERAFPYSQIVAELEKVFDRVRVVDLAGKVSEKSPRLHFICQK